MKYINIVTCSLLACYAMTFSTAGAENIRKKTKNAAGIEVTYQSSYKGKVMPGELLMKVVGNEVSLKQVRPEKENPRKYANRTRLPLWTTTLIIKPANPTEELNCPTEKSSLLPLPLNSEKGSRKSERNRSWD